MIEFAGGKVVVLQFSNMCWSKHLAKSRQMTLYFCVGILETRNRLHSATLRSHQLVLYPRNALHLISVLNLKTLSQSNHQLQTTWIFYFTKKLWGTSKVQSPDHPKGVGSNHKVVPLPSNKNTTAAKLSHVSHGVLFPFHPKMHWTWSSHWLLQRWDVWQWSARLYVVRKTLETEKELGGFWWFGFSEKRFKGHSTKKKGPFQTKMWGQKLLFSSFSGEKHVWCNMFLIFWTDHGLGEGDGPPAVSLLRVHMTWDDFRWIVSVDVFFLS